MRPLAGFAEPSASAHGFVGESNLESIMIRSYCTLIGIVGTAFAFGQTAAAAETKQAQTQASFESLDKNSDGKVSINEATEHDGLFVAFKDLDKDKDGNLTKEEFAEYRAAR